MFFFFLSNCAGVVRAGEATSKCLKLCTLTSHVYLISASNDHLIPSHYFNLHNDHPLPSRMQTLFQPTIIT